MVSFTHLPSTPAAMSKHAHPSPIPTTPSSKSKPSKSILKTPSSSIAAAGQKRKRIQMDIPSDISSDPASDSSGEQARSSPPRKKRARVTFDMDSPKSQKQQQQQEQLSANKGTKTTQQAKAGPAEKSTALVREEVRRAIQRHLNGDSDAYDRIKEMFSADPKALEDDGSPVYDLPSPVSLKNHLFGLLANVSTLDTSCSGLVYAVLGSEWVGRDKSYVDLFVKFLGTLAAARGAYLNSILKMLVSRLRQVPPRTGKIPGYKTIGISEIYTRIHYAIHYITQLNPAGSFALSPILSSSFPHDTDTAKNHVTYTRNLIRIIDYVPELKADILGLITEKLVKVDVQIQVDLEDFDEEVQEEFYRSLTSEELLIEEDEDAIDDESVIAEDDMDPEMQQLKVLKEKFGKVDYTIDILFEFHSIPFNSGSEEDKENTLDLLLSHFKTIILPTYRSRHSQFLLFHYAQSSPIFIDRFATTCAKIILEKSEPVIMRQYAAAYLASFVARGAHVSSEVVHDVFNLLASHLQTLLTEYEKACRGPDLRRYGPFYSTAQALLYIFVFRWRDLTTSAMESEQNNIALEHLDLDEISFSPEIKDLLHKAIYSKLNPLKICSPAIVEEFARVTEHLGLLFVHPLLEINKRLRIHTFRGLASMAMDTVFGNIERETRADDNRGPQLDDYFPFDPYNLPRSLHWVHGDYIHWNDIPKLDIRDDDDDDDDTASIEDDESDLDDEDDDTETETDEE